jgi:hypothetical protein
VQAAGCGVAAGPRKPAWNAFHCQPSRWQRARRTLPKGVRESVWALPLLPGSALAQLCRSVDTPHWHTAQCPAPSAHPPAACVPTLRLPLLPTPHLSSQSEIPLPVPCCGSGRLIPPYPEHRNILEPESIFESPTAGPCFLNSLDIVKDATPQAVFIRTRYGSSLYWWRLSRAPD